MQQEAVNDTLEFRRVKDVLLLTRPFYEVKSLFNQLKETNNKFTRHFIKKTIRPVARWKDGGKQLAWGQQAMTGCLASLKPCLLLRLLMRNKRIDVIEKRVKKRVFLIVLLYRYLPVLPLHDQIWHKVSLKWVYRQYHGQIPTHPQRFPFWGYLRQNYYKTN